MVKKIEPEQNSVIELQVYINPRGRSVINGTLLIDGEMRTVKYELSLSERSELERSMLSFLVKSKTV